MGNAAVELSEAFAAAVEKQGAHVVRVEGGRRFTSSGIVYSADGLILTASHGIGREEEVIVVGLPDGKEVKAKLLGRDFGTDLAVLRAEATGLSPVAFGSVDGLKVGHLVLAIARPGRSARTSLGIISALANEEWHTPTGGKLEKYIQPDGGTLPGIGGSLLADAAGNALGLNTTGLVRGSCITLPGVTLKRVADSLVAHGRIRRGFLGVGTYPVQLTGPLAAQLKQDAALAVVAIQPGGPSEKAGLLIGDVIATLDGKAVEHPGQLHRMLNEDLVGKEIVAKVVRGGQVLDVKITVGTRP